MQRDHTQMSSPKADPKVGIGVLIARGTKILGGRRFGIDAVALTALSALGPHHWQEESSLCAGRATSLDQESGPCPAGTPCCNTLWPCRSTFVVVPLSASHVMCRHLEFGETFEDCAAREVCCGGIQSDAVQAVTQAHMHQNMRASLGTGTLLD